MCIAKLRLGNSKVAVHVAVDLQCWYTVKPVKNKTNSLITNFFVNLESIMLKMTKTEQGKTKKQDLETIRNTDVGKLVVIEWKQPFPTATINSFQDMHCNNFRHHKQTT